MCDEYSVLGLFELVIGCWERLLPSAEKRDPRSAPAGYPGPAGGGADAAPGCHRRDKAAPRPRQATGAFHDRSTKGLHHHNFDLNVTLSIGLSRVPKSMVPSRPERSTVFDT